MQTKENTLTDIIVPANELTDLLTGAAIAAHSKDDLRKLNAVYLSVKDNKLVAVASDRYRLIEGSLFIEQDTPNVPDIALSLADVKQLIAALKPTKLAPTRITIAGDMVSVSLWNSNSLTYSSIGESFVPYEQLFGGENSPVDAIAFNPKFMADFGKVPSDKPMLNVEFKGNKQMTIKITHAKIIWRALLMPMRAGN